MGFGPEKKVWDTAIAYNPVVRLYTIKKNLDHQVQS